VLQTLGDLATILGNRPIIAGREVTKLHEEWKSGSATELASHFVEPTGEFVFVIPARELTEEPADVPEDDEIYAIFGRLTENTAVSRREAVKQVAKSLGLAPKYVYAAIERVKNIG
jgi:16S rRNA (cytidine1402-2'-O)-methyltransferase